MTRFKDLVPDEVKFWYYDEETGLLLHNTGEYGWLACIDEEEPRRRLEELQTALDNIGEDGLDDPRNVLPLD